MNLKKMIRLTTAAFGCAVVMMFGASITANAEEGITTMATTTHLNLREKATMKSKVLDVIPAKASVQVFGMTKDGWYDVEYEGTRGYAWYKYITFEGSAKGTVHDGHETDMYATTALHVREGSSTNYESIGVLKKGEAVPVISKHHGWFKVEYKGKEGYCYGQYLGFGQTDECKVSKEEDTTQNTMNKYTVSTALNVRSSAKMGNNIVGVLEKGEEINVIGMEGKWAKISYKGKEAYCYSTYLD